jgi:hypothetical protein
MTVQFPVLPRGAVVTPRLVRYGGDLISTLGGPTQRISRFGTRYAVTVELPTLDAVCAGRWLACPLAAEANGDTLTLIMPQALTVPPYAGTPTGTGPAGAVVIDILGPAAILPGTWFSFVSGGRNYLHLVTGVPNANRLTISPALRVPLNATALDFIAPKLEGFCEDTEWSLEWFKYVGHAFTLTESA